MSKKKQPITNPRLLAVLCFHEVRREGVLVPEAMARLDFKLEEEDRNLAHELVYGTFRYLPGLEHIIDTLVTKGRLPDRIRILLLISLYQLRFTRIPDYAVLDQANRLAPKLGFANLRKLVNGVLRNAQRRGDEIWNGLDEAQTLLPSWLHDLMVKHYPKAEVDSWLATWRERACLSYWSAVGEGLEGDEKSENPPNAYRRQKALWPWLIKKHKLYVQNESSQAIAELVLRLEPKSVLDTCAAPGGKACYMAAFGKLDLLTAVDSAPERIAVMERNRERLGLTFDIQRADMRNAELDQNYDVVLVDAPCSGIGIIGRHPEIKVLKSAAADQVQKDKQADILKAAWNHVKPGGYLLYTVCSLDPDEIPAPPEDAKPALDKLKDISKQMPFIFTEDRFYAPPTERYDGFTGILIQK